MDPGEAAEGPARDPDVEGVCAHQGQLPICVTDVADGGHGTETEDPTRRADEGAGLPTTTVSTRPGDAGGGGGAT
jgi:hypothetical protein